jgi:hypothetical protein
MTDLVALGTFIREHILGFAQLITLDHWPGLISLALFLSFVIVSGWLGIIVYRRTSVLNALTSLVKSSGDSAGFQSSLNRIAGKLKSDRSPESRRLNIAFAEFRETLLEPGQDGTALVRNALRPSVFINLDDLRFGVTGWRVWPGLFVSVGLLLTFLGLIAALAATRVSIEQGGGDQVRTIAALGVLLGTASAKFTMSLTGLFCSILFTLLHRVCTASLDRAVERVVHELETKMDFVSLEALADQQLTAIKEQTTQQSLLNTQLIAELSKPLERMSATGVEALGGMVSELGKSLISSLGASLDRVSARIDEAAEKLGGLAGSLNDASKQFEETLGRSIAGLGSAIGKMEGVADRLSTAADSVAATADPVMKTAGATAVSAQAVADGSMQLINAAKAAIDAERTAVVKSATSIESLIRAFEDRAKGYDGQLEKAFSTYLEQVQRTLGELRNHGDGVHKQYGDALQTLQAVIENAKAFRPESDAPQIPGSSA